jgi:DNA-binding NarL/FixJ family response regulator
MSTIAESISVVLIDDEPLFRQGLRRFFSLSHSDTAVRVQVVGEADSVEQGLDLIQTRKPDMILLDMELPHLNGLDALLHLKEQAYAGDVVVLSAHQDDQWIFLAMQSGAKGYVLKESVTEQLPTAIATVLAGKIYLAPDVATCFFRRFQDLASQSLPLVKSLHLTEREQDVLYWLVQGEPNTQIARHLFVTVATVKAHLTSIFEKLGVSSRTQAIVKALRLGLLTYSSR